MVWNWSCPNKCGVYPPADAVENPSSLSLEIRSRVSGPVPAQIYAPGQVSSLALLPFVAPYAVQVLALHCYVSVGEDSSAVAFLQRLMQGSTVLV